MITLTSCGWNFNTHGGAFARSALDPYGPAMRIHDVLHQAQAQARALDEVGHGGATEEPVEHVRTVLGHNPDAPVTHADGNGAWQRFGRQPHGVAAGRVLRGIVHEVVHGRGERFAVGPYRWKRIRDVRFQPLAANRPLRPAGHIDEPGGGVERREVILPPAGLHPREVEHALDQPRQPFAFLQDHLEVLPAALRRRHAAVEQLGELADARERRPELVRHGRHELRLQPRHLHLALHGSRDEHRTNQQRSDHQRQCRDVHPQPRRERAFEATRPSGLRVDLPDHTLQNAVDKEIDLRSYVETYLEEEVRQEALVRNVGAFGRFVELAGREAGRVANYSRISQDVGVSSVTVQAYYEILCDCLVAERVEPITRSASRKKLTKASRYLMFDVGVARVAAREGRRLPLSRLGELFEQFVGIEIIRFCRLHAPGARLRFWRDPDGPEVDWVLERHAGYLPIEVKLGDRPTERDARHLDIFLKEYGGKHGLIVCSTPRPLRLTRMVSAIPWQDLPDALAGML